MQVMETLGKNELIQAIDSMNLRVMLSGSNYTVFAPNDTAFASIKPNIDLVR